MSLRVETDPRPIAADDPRPDRAGPGPARSRRGAWGLAAIAALLATSGAVRAHQERRVERTLARGRVAAFPLAEVPMTLGPWDGHPTTLDPRIVRGSGSTDLIVRRYVDRRTGTALDVVVTFGPTSDMFIHTPELCYPAAGFRPSPASAVRPIEPGPGAPAVPFRSLLFTKGEGGLAEAQEVYYSLWYDGRWTTAASSPKASKRIAGMYKIQVSRRVSDRERRDLENPIESFLVGLVAEIESRMARGRALEAGGPGSPAS